MKIFISYRRIDSADFSGRIYDRLANHFGAANVFKDIDVIPLGTDFMKVLEQEIIHCDVVLAIIGNNWLDVKDAKGQRRLDDQYDFVRIEIETALSRGIPVIPVLLRNASLPSPDQLPDGLEALAFRNAISINSDPDFHREVDRLIQALTNLSERIPERITTKTSAAPDLEVDDFEPSYVFISHSSLDRTWVEEEIINFLESQNIKIWYSKAAIGTASQWEREILRGLEKCDWFLLVVSPRSAESEWVKDELFWAMHHRPTRIVPVIMEQCDLWNFHIRLPRIQHADFTQGSVLARKKLLQVFRA